MHEYNPGGILGYATPPSSFNNPYDGVVVGYRYFGTLGTVQDKKKAKPLETNYRLIKEVVDKLKQIKK